MVYQLDQTINSCIGMEDWLAWEPACFTWGSYRTSLVIAVLKMPFLDDSIRKKYLSQKVALYWYTMKCRNRVEVSNQFSKPLPSSGSAKNGTRYWIRVSLMHSQKCQGKWFRMFVSTTQKPPILCFNSSGSEIYFNSVASSSILALE